MKRALLTLNWVAIVMAVITAFALVLNEQEIVVTSPWVLALIAINLLYAGFVAIPFAFMASVLCAAVTDEPTKVKVGIVNIILCIVAGFEVLDMMDGRKAGFMEMYCMGFAPLALLNALWLMLSKQPTTAN